MHCRRRKRNLIRSYITKIKYTKKPSLKRCNQLRFRKKMPGITMNEVRYALWKIKANRALGGRNCNKRQPNSICLDELNLETILLGSAKCRYSFKWNNALSNVYCTRKITKQNFESTDQFISSRIITSRLENKLYFYMPEEKAGFRSWSLTDCKTLDRKVGWL